MNLKEDLIQRSSEEIIEAAKSLSEIMKPKLIESANKGYLGLSINLQENPEYIEPYLKFVGNKEFRKELSSQLDGISVSYEQEPRYLQALGHRTLVGHTPLLTFNWNN